MLVLLRVPMTILGCVGLISVIAYAALCLVSIPMWFAILVLGPKRLPEAGRGLGKSMREFKSGISGISGESETAAEPEAKTTSTSN